MLVACAGALISLFVFVGVLIFLNGLFQEIFVIRQARFLDTLVFGILILVHGLRPLSVAPSTTELRRVGRKDGKDIIPLSKALSGSERKICLFVKRLRRGSFGKLRDVEPNAVSTMIKFYTFSHDPMVRGHDAAKT